MMMRKTHPFVVFMLLFFAGITLTENGHAAFPERNRDAVFGPDSAKGPLGLPPTLFFGPGDSVMIPVQFYAPVPVDSQVTGIAMTIRTASPDFAFWGNIDTTHTPLHGWSFAVASAGDSVRIEATAPNGAVFVRPDQPGPPAILFVFGGTISPAVTDGDSLELALHNVSLTSKGHLVGFADPDFNPTIIFIGPPHGEKGGLFALADTSAKPGESVTLRMFVLDTVPADSQVSRIKATLRAMPPQFHWDMPGVSVAPALAGWSVVSNANSDTIHFEVVAPPNTFLIHNDPMPLHLLTFTGHVLPGAPGNSQIDIVPEHVQLTLHGQDLNLDNMAFAPGRIFVEGDSMPPPPQGNHQALLGFPFGMFSPPGSETMFPLLFFEPAPADSEVSGFSFTAKPSSPFFKFHTEIDTTNSALKGWTMIVTGNADSTHFQATAPAGHYFEHLNPEPAELVLLKGSITPDAQVGDSIWIHLFEVTLTMHGAPWSVPDSLVQPGQIKVGEVGPPPAGNEIFAFLETQAKPDSNFMLAFAAINSIPADSQVSRIRAVVRAIPQELTWASTGHVLAPELSGWSLNTTAGGDSLAFDLKARAGSFLAHEGNEPLVLVSFAGKVKSSAPSQGDIAIMPEKLMLTVHGTEVAVEPWLIRPGRISIGSGTVVPPPPPPPPPITSSGGRTNLGLYGGTVLDMAFDSVHGIVVAAVAAPQSVFISADSGWTWSAAFPYDSLEFKTGGTTRGFGGRGVQVEATGGYCYARTNQEAGTLTGSQVSDDGVNWRTLMDPYRAENVLLAAFGGSVAIPPAIQTLSASGPVALVGANNFVFRTTDAGNTWDISVVPTASALTSTKQTRVLDLRRDDSSGQSFYVGLSETWGSPSDELYLTENGVDFTRLFVTFGSDTVRGIMALSSHPYTSDTLWVSTVDPVNPALSGVWRSYDAGSTWTKVFTAANPMMAPVVTIYEDSSYPGSDHLRLFLVGEDQYSDDLGDSWNHFSPQNDPTVPRVSAANAAIGHIPDTDIYFSQGDGSPARSTSGLSSYYYFDPTGIEGITIWGIAQIPNQPDKVYLATSVGVAYTSKFTDTTVTSTAKWASPYGNYPINPNNGGNTKFTAIAIDPHNTSHIIAANGNGIFVARTGGFTNDTWNAVSYEQVTGLDVTIFKNEGGRVSKIAFITSDSVIASAYCQRTLYGTLLLSTDGGSSWSTMPQAGNHNFKAVIAAWNTAQDSVVLFTSGGAVTEDPGTHTTLIDSGAVYKSLDWGTTWSRAALAPYGTFNPATFPLPINDIMAKPGSLDTLYMACGDNLSNAIVRTFDGGFTLESISMAAIGAREGAFEAVAINKNNPDSVYFAIRRDILVYDAAADTATTLFRGYPGELTHALLYDDLTMGSSSGFYEIKTTATQSTTGVRDQSPRIPFEVELAQNYPNPFNPATRILFTLPQGGKVKLEIFNILGQRVEELVSGLKKAGKHEVVWQPMNQASGTYFYRLQVVSASGHEQILTRRLMLIK